MQVPRPYATVTTGSTLRWAKRDHGAQLPCTKRSPERPHEPFVTHVAHSLAGSSGSALDDPHRHRLHRRVGGDRGLDQAGMKWQHRAAVARCSLRKYREDVSVLQGLRHSVHHPHGVAPRLTLHVQGASARHDGPEQRPVCDVGLRHETASAYRVQREDVDPGDVIGHQQHGPDRRRRTDDLQVNVEPLQHLARPPPDSPLTLWLREPGKQEPALHDAAEHMRTDTPRHPASRQLVHVP